jgi:hypothetical protein
MTSFDENYHNFNKEGLLVNAELRYNEICLIYVHQIIYWEGFLHLVQN